MNVRRIIKLPGVAEPGPGQAPSLPAQPNVIYAAIAGDLAVAIAKFLAAAFTGSSAMLAEGFHSLVDTGNELLLLIGLHRSHHAADQDRAFGYGKVSYFWSLIVALSICTLGGGLSIYQGIVNLHNPPQLENPTWNYIVLAVAALFEGYSWRVSDRALERRRHRGDSLWQAVRRSKDASVFTVFFEDSAALIGITIAALGVGLSHFFDNPYFDPAASVLIGLVLVIAAFLLARESGGLLVGESLDRGQIIKLRRLIAADVDVDSVHRLRTMQLGPDRVLLTAAIRFHRDLSLDQVEQATLRLERAIKLHYPSIHHLFLESVTLKDLARSTRNPAATPPP